MPLEIRQPKKRVDMVIKRVAMRIRQRIPFVKEVFLVGGRACGKTVGDVDLVLISPKPLERFSVEEYTELIGLEQELSEKHGLNFELFVSSKAETLGRKGKHKRIL